MEDVALLVQGTHVHGVFAGPKKAKHGALLVHGLGSNSSEFGDLQSTLADAGIASLAIDIRGHGKSDGEQGMIGLRHAMDDMEVASEHLRSRLKRNAPITGIGHSLGGAYVIGAASRTNWFQSLVVAHPVDRIFDELSPLKRLGFHAIGKLGRLREKRGKDPGQLKRPPNYSKLFVSKEAAARAKKEDFLLHEANLRGYTFATTMQASNWARSVKIPVLGIQGEADRIVKPEHTRDVLDAFAGPVQRIAHRGGHSCWRDLDGDRLAAAVVAFMEAQ